MAAVGQFDNQSQLGRFAPVLGVGCWVLGAGLALRAGAGCFAPVLGAGFWVLVWALRDGSGRPRDAEMLFRTHLSCPGKFLMIDSGLRGAGQLEVEEVEAARTAEAT
jgi:hypothetical protein